MKGFFTGEVQFKIKDMFNIPDVEYIRDFNGKFNWVGFKIKKKENLLETFIFNSRLHRIFDSISDAYVSIKKGKNYTRFFRDSQDCIMYYVKHKTGEVLDSYENVVAKNIEQFWFRAWLENDNLLKHNLQQYEQWSEKYFFIKKEINNPLKRIKGAN